MCFLHHSSFGFNVMCTFCIRNIDCNLLNQHNNCLQKLYKVYFFLDFLKVLRFSFPVPVVGPSPKTFIPCRAPNLQEEFSSRRFYPITNGFTDAPSIKPDYATWNVTWTVLNCVFCGLYFDFVLSPVSPEIQSFRGRFKFLYLSTLPRQDFPGSHGMGKRLVHLYLWLPTELDSTHLSNMQMPSTCFQCSVTRWRWAIIHINNVQ